MSRNYQSSDEFRREGERMTRLEEIRAGVRAVSGAMSSFALPLNVAPDSRLLFDAHQVLVAGFNYSEDAVAAALAINVHDDLLAALREIETICSESTSDCRRRMGTRAGNALVTARAAIAKAALSSDQHGRTA